MAIFAHHVLPHGPDVYFVADDAPEWSDVEATYDVPNANPPRTATIASSAQWTRYDTGSPPPGAIKGTLVDTPKPPTGSKATIV
jgi:hypothetical protein